MTDSVAWVHPWQLRLVAVKAAFSGSHTEILEDIIRSTGMETMELILWIIRLQWLGHIHRMDRRQTNTTSSIVMVSQKMAKEELEDPANAAVTHFRSAEHKDDFDKYGENADERAMRKRCVAQCVPTALGRIKVRFLFCC